ncbi:MAG: Lrp/AsnC family transcriptional regulator [Desulfurococcaceae archaeon]
MVDEIDRRILEILMKNARTPYSSIARALGISDVAVLKRARRLERDGVIKGYRAIVNPSALGYERVSITGVNVRPELLLDVINALKTMEQVKFLATASGDHDIVAVIWARNGRELAEIHERIAKVNGVVAVYPMVIVDVIKDEASL